MLRYGTLVAAAATFVLGATFQTFTTTSTLNHCRFTVEGGKRSVRASACVVSSEGICAGTAPAQ